MSVKTSVHQKGKVKGSQLKHTVLIAVALFIFWYILSGKADAEHLLMGVGCAVGVALATRSIQMLPSPVREQYWPSWDFPWLRMIAYIPWLLYQIAKANIEVAVIILNPRLPMEPQVFKFPQDFDHPLAYAVLANSITLTPGTVTMDVSDGYYTVHAFYQSAKEGLYYQGEVGDLVRRVEHVFALDKGEERVSSGENNGEGVD